MPIQPDLLGELYATWRDAWIRIAGIRAGKEAEDLVHNIMVLVLDPEESIEIENFVDWEVTEWATGSESKPGVIEVLLSTTRGQLRQRSRRMTMMVRLTRDGQVPLAASRPRTPTWEELERRMAVQRAMESLPARQSALAWLVFGQGERLVRAASDLGLSRQEARSLIGKAAETLRRELSRCTSTDTTPPCSFTPGKSMTSEAPSATTTT